MASIVAELLLTINGFCSVLQTSKLDKSGMHAISIGMKGCLQHSGHSLDSKYIFQPKTHRDSYEELQITALAYFRLLVVAT